MRSSVTHGGTLARACCLFSVLPVPVLLFPRPIISLFNLAFPITRSSSFLKVRCVGWLPTSFSLLCHSVGGWLRSVAICACYTVSLVVLFFAPSASDPHTAFRDLRMPQRRAASGRRHILFFCSDPGFAARAPVSQPY